MTEKTKIWYARQTKGISYRYSGEYNAQIYDLDDDTDQEYIADQCAEDFYNNHDGQQCTWPIIFEFFLDNNPESESIFVCEVELEYTPEFYSKRKVNNGN
jgi:hypothetical protein